MSCGHFLSTWASIEMSAIVLPSQAFVTLQTLVLASQIRARACLDEIPTQFPLSWLPGAALGQKQPPSSGICAAAKLPAASSPRTTLLQELGRAGLPPSCSPWKMSTPELAFLIGRLSNPFSVISTVEKGRADSGRGRSQRPAASV